MSSVDHPAADGVLKQLEERTRPEPDGVQNSQSNVWTSRQRLRSDAAKPHTDYDKDSLTGVLAALEDAHEIVSFHGLLAPATPDHLRAIIQNEGDAEITRRTLVKQCNRLSAAQGGDGDE